MNGRRRPHGPPPVTPAAYPWEARRGQVDQQLATQDGITKLSCFLEFDGAGEQLAEVNFPCRFIDKPICGDSFDLDSAGSLESRNFPWTSCGAIFRTEDRAGHLYYVGATLIIVIGGPRRQRITIHWSAEGKAIVGPVTDSET